MKEYAVSSPVRAGLNFLPRIDVNFFHDPDRPSHLKIPGGPKMDHAALSRRAIDGNVASKRGDSCLLAQKWLVQTPLEGPFRRP